MTEPHPTEVELKLALPPQQVDAFLKRMARRRSVPMQQELITRYFDTPDFALSAQGVALRVRRVGRRWLQTLKTEGERRGGLSRRLEYEMPVTRGTPEWNRFPADALAWLPEALRGQLRPVFETHFHRTAWLLKGKGGAQIEVALDVGEVRAGKRRQPICEVELELKGGQPEALFELAQEWAQQFDFMPFDVSKAERGVRLAHGQAAEPVKSAAVVLGQALSVEAGFAAIIQACLAQFQGNLPGVLASDDIEYVHQARVALRRLRAALRLFRRVCVLPEALMDGLQTLAAALGPARDWDVLCCETLPAIAPHDVDKAGWQRGVAVLDRHRREVRASMQAALAEAHPGAWLLAFQRWLLQHGWRSAPSGERVPEEQRFVQLSPLDKWARKALQKGHRPIIRGVRKFARLQPAQRHALRIAAKRQRYATEFFRTLFGTRRQARYLAALQAIQDDLGRANDARVASELVMSMQEKAGPMGQFALGWLAAKQADAGTGGDAACLQNFIKLPPCW